jgi:hypothetical protein
MSNLPPGVRYSDPRAPWNAPDTTSAEIFAREQVTNGEDLCRETFGEWLVTLDWIRKPLLVKQGLICGTASDAELLKLVLSCDHDVMTLAAVKELRARYLADAYTQRVISDEVGRALGEPA